MSSQDTDSRKHRPIQPPSPQSTADIDKGRPSKHRPLPLPQAKNMKRVDKSTDRDQSAPQRNKTSVWRRLGNNQRSAGGGGGGYAKDIRTHQQPNSNANRRQGIYVTNRPNDKPQEICRRFLNSGQCPYGDSCIHKHIRRQLNKNRDQHQPRQNRSDGRGSKNNNKHNPNNVRTVQYVNNQPYNRSGESNNARRGTKRREPSDRDNESRRESLVKRKRLNDEQLLKADEKDAEDLIEERRNIKRKLAQLEEREEQEHLTEPASSTSRIVREEDPNLPSSDDDEEYANEKQLKCEPTTEDKLDDCISDPELHERESSPIRIKPELAVEETFDDRKPPADSKKKDNKLMGASDKREEFDRSPSLSSPRQQSSKGKDLRDDHATAATPDLKHQPNDSERERSRQHHKRSHHSNEKKHRQSTNTLQSDDKRRDSSNRDRSSSKSVSKKRDASSRAAVEYSNEPDRVRERSEKDPRKDTKEKDRPAANTQRSPHSDRSATAHGHKSKSTSNKHDERAPKEEYRRNRDKDEKYNRKPETGKEPKRADKERKRADTNNNAQSEAAHDPTEKHKSERGRESSKRKDNEQTTPSKHDTPNRKQRNIHESESEAAPDLLEATTKVKDSERMDTNHANRAQSIHDTDEQTCSNSIKQSPSPTKDAMVKEDEEAEEEEVDSNELIPEKKTEDLVLVSDVDEDECNLLTQGSGSRAAIQELDWNALLMEQKELDCSSSVLQAFSASALLQSVPLCTDHITPALKLKIQQTCTEDDGTCSLNLDVDLSSQISGYRKQQAVQLANQQLALSTHLLSANHDLELRRALCGLVPLTDVQPNMNELGAVPAHLHRASVQLLASKIAI